MATMQTCSICGESKEAKGKIHSSITCTNLMVMNNKMLAHPGMYALKSIFLVVTSAVLIPPGMVIVNN